MTKHNTASRRALFVLNTRSWVHAPKDDTWNEWPVRKVQRGQVKSPFRSNTSGRADHSAEMWSPRTGGELFLCEAINWKRKGHRLIARHPHTRAVCEKVGADPKFLSGLREAVQT